MVSCFGDRDPAKRPFPCRKTAAPAPRVSASVIVSVKAVEPGLDALDEQLIGQLVDRARVKGIQLTGDWTHPIGCAGGWPRQHQPVEWLMAQLRAGGRARKTIAWPVMQGD